MEEGWKKDERDVREREWPRERQGMRARAEKKKRGQAKARFIVSGESELIWQREEGGEGRNESGGRKQGWSKGGGSVGLRVEGATE